MGNYLVFELCLVLWVRCSADVHRGKHREDVRLEERNQDLEGRQENEQAEWQDANRNEEEAHGLGLDQRLLEQCEDHE